MRRFLLATTGIALVIASGPLGQGEAQEIGNVAAVNRDMAGTPPTASRRLLELGQNVVRNERIETSDRGAGQLLFVDQTSLTISPNTDILLDEYVYNPAEDTGDVALTMTRGALRFIGGRISKKRRALIRTPTATIGIRGGMVLIQVADDGATRVTHLAGESTTIVSFGDNDSDGFDDGPGPAELEEFVAGAPVDAPQQVTLSRTSSTATTGEPAQQGQPTEVTFTGQTSADELEEVYGSFEGNQDGGTESPPSDADVAQQTQPIAQINSEVPNGQDSQPISTSGESNEGSTSASEPQEPPQQELETTPSTETAIVEEIDTDIDTGGGTGGGTLPPLGLATGGALFVPGVGIETFVEISEGSFVGTTATGETVTLNIPTAADQLRPVNPETDSTFFAQTRFPNSGFFVIEEGDAVSSEFGALTGVGFADLDNNLFIAGLSDASEDAGLIFFGNNTPNQNAAFSFDPNAPADANSVTEFVAEASFDPSEGPGGERVSLVTNGANAPGGARILFGEVSVEPIEGGQVSELSVIAAPFEQQTTGGPRISTAIIDSFALPFNDGLIEFSESNIGTLEDAEGHTLFGAENDYIVVTSAFRDENGTFVFDQPGEGIAITNQGEFAFTNEGDAALLTRDPDTAFVVADPLPLANDTTSRLSQTGSFDGVFATGFASCGSNRVCGQQLTNQNAPGFYALTPINDGEETAITSGVLDFQPGGEDRNTFQTALLFTDNGESGLEAGPNGGDFFTFTPSSEATAYIDDNRFAAADTDAVAIVGGTQTTASFALLSAGANNDGVEQFFPANTKAEPEFVRWGWFSAQYTGTDATTGQTGTDIVHLGTFVSGVLPGPDDFGALTAEGRFEGIAAGTTRDLASGAQMAVFGTSTLDYDFGQRAGDLNLSLPDAGINTNIAVSGIGANIPQFSGDVTETGLSGSAQGAFFAGGGSAAAATGGTFDIIDTGANAQTLGVFAADAVPNTQ